MFVQAEKFLEAHHREGSDISVYGQESNERTWRMAKMNLAIHGLNGNLASRWGDTFARDQHPDLQADYVMANPPFPRKLTCWGLVCGRDFERGPGDVEAGPVAA
jgi:type I restriction enzyme M protein